MKRWKYHSLIIRDLAIADAKLNAEGEKGWELISVCLVDSNTARAYFKMSVDETSSLESLNADTALVSSNPF